MPSRNINDLTPQVRDKAQLVLETCPCELLIYCTLRTHEEQAMLWRQSRSLKTIQSKIYKFEARGQFELAKILWDVGPQKGRHVTYACCGESFHNYGEAFDIVPMRHGKPLWSIKNIEWKIYGLCLRNAGLTWGGDWERFKDYPHAQLRAGGNPLKIDMSV